MARYYDSFEKLKENVTETYSNIAMLLEKFNWDFFSEDGANQIAAYSILEYAFQCAWDHNDLVEIVADEIGNLKKKLDNSSLAEAVNTKAIINYLVKYIRFNLHEDFWKDYPEFNKNNARGLLISPHHLKGDITMAKKTEPILTHTEILCFAIRHLISEIEDIKRKGESLAKRTGNKEMADGITDALIEPIAPKLAALKELYCIETGTDYE